MIRTYSELSKLKTFKERFEYLKVNDGGHVGEDTFGWRRYLNQQFYKSPEWRAIRRDIIIRDNGCDLGIDGHDIHGRIIIHHLVPLTKDDVELRTKYLTDPEYLICVSHATHNAIHYGSENSLLQEPIERSKNDTCPWRRD